MEAKKTTRQPLHPMSYYMNMVKDMDDRQKLELMTIIIDSMKTHSPAKAEQTDVLRPYTMAEIDAMLDEAEHNYKAGLGIPSEEVFRDLEEEFEQKQNRQIYWDDVALFCHPEEYQLGVREMRREDIIEIDDLRELAAMDAAYVPLLTKEDS